MNCIYCNNAGNRILSQDGVFRIMGDKLLVTVFKGDIVVGTTSFQIKYCPICGKALEQEETKEKPIKLPPKKYVDEF